MNFLVTRALFSPPKTDFTDTGIEFAPQVFAKSNQADVAPHDIPELNFPAISFADEVAEGPVMVLYLWSQFYCEIMIAVARAVPLALLPNSQSAAMALVPSAQSANRRASSRSIMQQFLVN